MANIVVNSVLCCGSKGSGCGSCSNKKSCCCCSDVDYKGIWAGLFLVKSKQNSYLDAIGQLNGTTIANSSNTTITSD